MKAKEAKEAKKNTTVFSDDAKKKAIASVKKTLANVLKMDGVTAKEYTNKYDALELDICVDGVKVIEVDIDNKPRQYKVVVSDDIHALIKDIASNDYGAYQVYQGGWQLKYNYRFTTKEYARYGTCETLKEAAERFSTFLKAVNDTLVSAMATANNDSETDKGVA